MARRKLTFSEIPTREEFKELTLELLEQGVTNSDDMRARIANRLGVSLEKTGGDWSSSASGRFVNMHAWGLESLVLEKLIVKVRRKEYVLGDSAPPSVADAGQEARGGVKRTSVRRPPASQPAQANGSQRARKS